MQLSTEPVPAVAVQPTFFQPTVTPPFQHAMGSAFAAGCNGPVPTNDPLAAFNANRHFIKTEGAKHGIPEPILDMAANEGHTLELIIASYSQAKMAGELFIYTSQHTDFTKSPLAQRMAELLVQNHSAANTPVPTGAKDEETLKQELAADAQC